MAVSRKENSRGVRWQAAYRAPDGRERTRTFAKKVDAERWLRQQGSARDRGAWVDPRSGRTTFGVYAKRWQAVQIHRPQTVARRLEPALPRLSVLRRSPAHLDQRDRDSGVGARSVEHARPSFRRGLLPVRLRDLSRSRSRPADRLEPVRSHPASEEGAPRDRSARGRARRGARRRDARSLPGARRVRRRHRTSPGRGVRTQARPGGIPAALGRGLVAARRRPPCAAQDGCELPDRAAPSDGRRGALGAPEAVPGRSRRPRVHQRAWWW